MLRRAGKLTAILMAGLMIASPLTEVVTFADELESIRDENVMTQELSGDSSEEILTENTSDDENDEAVVLDADEDTPEAEDADASFEAGQDDLDADSAVPVTSGKVLRLASAGTGIQKNQHIYFGKESLFTGGGDSKHGATPYWRVLDPEKANNGFDPQSGTIGYMFLMSEALWGNAVLAEKKDFTFDNSSNIWEASSARTLCNTLYTLAFATIEQNAITGLTKYDGNFDSWFATDLTTGDKVFLLSAKELYDYVGSPNWPGEDESRKAMYQGTYRKYWLRSKGESGTSKYVAGVTSIGEVSDTRVAADSYGYLRPAFNLKKDNILFTSAAENGKPGDGKLEFVKEGNVTDWKLTLRDDSRNSFDAGIVGSKNVKAGGKIKVHFSNAKTGEKEYVSAVICDSKDENILYYGRIVNNKGTDDMELTVPSDLDAGKYNLKVFSEQYNEDRNTDYASDPKTFPIEIEKSEQTITASNFTKKVGDAVFNIGAKTSGDGKLTYQSSNQSVAKVDASGNVTIVGPGTATITITASETSNYKATKKEITVTVSAAGKTDITKATVTGIKNKTYNGKARSQTPTVTLAGKKLAKGSDYDIKYLGDRKSVGTQKFQIIGKNNYTGTLNKSFKINKAKNTLNVSLKKKKVSVKESDVESKNKTIKANKVIKVSKAIGKVTYKKKSGDSKIKVSSSGKITVKKGLKKGTYKVKVQVKAKGNTNYHSKKKDVSFKIVVK